MAAGRLAADPGLMTTGDDAARQTAKQIRGDHPAWLVIWVARTQRYHAYRLAAANAGAGLTDTESAGLIAQLQQAERAAASRPARPPRGDTVNSLPDASRRERDCH